jgi:hypothetical protein
MLEFRKDLFADERDDDAEGDRPPTQRQDMLGPRHRASKYFDDHKVQGLLHLKVLRSPTTTPGCRHIDVSGRRAIARGAPGSSGPPTSGEPQHAPQPARVRQGRRA